MDNHSLSAALRTIRKAWLFFALFVLYLLAPFMANEKPLLSWSANGFSFPAFDERVYEANVDAFVVHAPIPWSPGKSDLANAEYRGPFDRQFGKAASLGSRHWLGTDLRGADVLSGILHGARESLFVSVTSVLLALLFALLIGGLAGWYSGRKAHVPIALILWVLYFSFSVFQFVQVVHFQNTNALLLPFLTSNALLGCLLYVVHRILSKWKLAAVAMDVDRWILQLISLLSAMPKLILILILAALLPSSRSMVIFLLFLFTWPDLARIFRTEVIRIRPQQYLEAALLTGAGLFRLLRFHLLPNAAKALFVSCIYAIAGNVLLEASLGFLGIGIPASAVSWGTLLAAGREHMQAWWLVLFPGIFLTLTILAMHQLVSVYFKGAER